MADLADNGLNRKIVDSASLAKEVDAMEAEIAELRHAYEQYFLGLERKPPTFEHNELKKKMLRLKGSFVRQTAVKFRINAIQQKFQSYERLWSRTLQEIENGTYQRDLFKAKLHAKEREQRNKKKTDHTLDDLPEAEVEAIDEIEEVEELPPPPPPAAKPASVSGITTKPAGTPAAAPAGVAMRMTPAAQPAIAKPATGSAPAIARPATGSAPAVAKPVTGSAPAAAAAKAPAAPAARPPPAPGGNPQLSDAKLKAVYDAYVTAKKRSGEDTSKISYDQVAANLRKQVPELLKKSGASSVEFKIVIKDGKAVLRAIPK